jgi:hypothetical protein
VSFADASAQLRLDVTAEQPQLRENLGNQFAGVEHADNGTFRHDDRHDAETFRDRRRCEVSASQAKRTSTSSTEASRYRRAARIVPSSATVNAPSSCANSFTVPRTFASKRLVASSPDIASRAMASACRASAAL